MSASGLLLAGSGVGAQASTARCGASSLRAAVTTDSGAAGTRHATLRLRNASRHTCELHGFPGAQLQHDARPTRNRIVRDAGSVARTVVVRPGATALSSWRWPVMGDHCSTPQVAFVTPPDGRTAIRVDWSSGRVCGDVTVSAMRHG